MPHHPVPDNMWTEGLSTADRPQKKKKKKCTVTVCINVAQRHVVKASQSLRYIPHVVGTLSKRETYSISLKSRQSNGRTK